MGNKKLIVAHRGASGIAPENTLEAFQKAIDLGADVAELDIRKTRDDVLVVAHDADFNGGLIRDLSFEELSAKSAWRIPSLESAIKLISGKIKLDAELKERGYEKQLGQLLLKYLPAEDFFVSSFSPGCLVDFKKLFPQIKTGLIVSTDRRDYLKILKLIVSGVFARQFDIYVLSVKFWEAGVASLLKASGKPVYMWNVDKEDELEKYLQISGLTGICTNRPDIAVKVRSALAL